MKLLRHGPAGHEKPGFLDDEGRIRDLSSLLPDITPDRLAPAALAELARQVAARGPSWAVVPEGTRLGSPIAGIR
ncbi:MAG: 2-hydroxyhepta-2,4-diene-1,7-dioate isomerase, partial [Betaproteobacteria bacterium]